MRGNLFVNPEHQPKVTDLCGMATLEWPGANLTVEFSNQDRGDGLTVFLDAASEEALLKALQARDNERTTKRLLESAPDWIRIEGQSEGDATLAGSERHYHGDGAGYTRCDDPGCPGPQDGVEIDLSRDDAPASGAYDVAAEERPLADHASLARHEPEMVR